MRHSIVIHSIRSLFVGLCFAWAFSACTGIKVASQREWETDDLYFNSADRQAANEYAKAQADLQAAMEREKQLLSESNLMSSRNNGTPSPDEEYINDFQSRGRLQYYDTTFNTRLFTQRANPVLVNNNNNNTSLYNNFYNNRWNNPVMSPATMMWGMGAWNNCWNCMGWNEPMSGWNSWNNWGTGFSVPILTGNNTFINIGTGMIGFRRINRWSSWNYWNSWNAWGVGWNNPYNFYSRVRRREVTSRPVSNNAPRTSTTNSTSIGSGTYNSSRSRTYSNTSSRGRTYSSGSSTGRTYSSSSSGRSSSSGSGSSSSGRSSSGSSGRSSSSGSRSGGRR